MSRNKLMYIFSMLFEIFIGYILEYYHIFPAIFATQFARSNRQESIHEILILLGHRKVSPGNVSLACLSACGDQLIILFYFHPVFLNMNLLELIY